MELKDSVALITGGASGLGEATLRAITAAGGHVGIVDLNRDRAEGLAAEFPGQVIHAGRDVTDEGDIAAAITATQSLGPLTAAINCAGIATSEKTLGRDGPHALETYARTLDINLKGSFNVARLAAQAMAENTPNADGERGSIIFTASVAAFDGQKGQPAYAASKGGIVGMVLPMARDLASHGIRVNAIAPGLFTTPMLAGLPEKAQAALADQPLFPKRLGHPQEFGRLATFLITCPYMNAETIRLDAGIRMS
ncbi:MAG: SDR family NAD(P)-dependent oxidoreductase [Pseudomonadota bacterium]